MDRYPLSFTWEEWNVITRALSTHIDSGRDSIEGMIKAADLHNAIREVMSEHFVTRLK